MGCLLAGVRSEMTIEQKEGVKGRYNGTRKRELSL